MRSELVSKLVGAAVGAALVIAGLVAFSPAIASMRDNTAQPAMQVVLHASEEINVRAN